MCVFCVWLCDLVLLCVTGWHITCCLTVYQAAWSSVGVVVCLDCVNNALFFFFSHSGLSAPFGTESSRPSFPVLFNQCEPKSLLACSFPVLSLYFVLA